MTDFFFKVLEILVWKVFVIIAYVLLFLPKHLV